MRRAILAAAALGLTAYFQRRYIDRELERRFHLYAIGTTGELDEVVTEICKRVGDSLNKWTKARAARLTQRTRRG